MKNNIIIFLLIGILLFCSCTFSEDNSSINLGENQTTSMEEDQTTTPEEDQTTIPEEDQTTTPDNTGDISIGTIELPEKFPRHFNKFELESLLKNYSCPSFRDLTPISSSDYVFLFDYIQRVKSSSPSYNRKLQLEAIHETNAVEYIEQVDDDHICVVYKISCENGTYEYVYILFEKALDDSATFEQYLWQGYGEIHFGKNLFFEDLSNVNIGDTYNQVADILPCLNLDYHAYFNFDRKDHLRNTTLMLKDGVLELTFECLYEERDNLDALKLTDIRFHPYGTEAKSFWGIPLVVLTAPNRPPLPGEDD